MALCLINRTRPNGTGNRQISFSPAISLSGDRYLNSTNHLSILSTRLDPVAARVIAVDIIFKNNREKEERK